MFITAAAAAIATWIGATSAVAVAAVNFGVRYLASSVVSSLLSNRDGGSAPGAQADQGSRIQLPPATDNKLGVVYGSAYVSPVTIDAKISADQQTMWYVLALTEVTQTGVLTMGNIDSTTNTDIYWGDKQLIFGHGSDRTRVTSWITGDGQTDARCNGNMFVYLYRDGSTGGANTTQSAITVLSDSTIAPDQRWNSSRYTGVGYSPTMHKTAFAIVKLKYNQDAGVTQLEQFKIKLTNSLTRPGDCIRDYLTSDRYGCGIPITQVNTANLTALNDYSDQLITYTTVNNTQATQPRYRVNGPINAGATCLQNLQTLVDTCDSWLQWNEAIAQWGVVMNRSYLDTTTYNDLLVINSSSITTGVSINPVDLTSSYNIVESQFPNKYIKDQTDYNFVYLDTADLNPNEPTNKLVMQLPMINDSVQAQYLGTRRLIQSREDLVVTFGMDYSGIQIDAGDVVRVQHPTYGWGPYAADPTNPDKLFRVEQVQEAKTEDGQLGVKLVLIEYNEQVYANIDIQDYDPAANTGLTDPTIVGTPAAPTVIDLDVDAGTFSVQAIVPLQGQITSMEYWYGPTIDIENNNYRLWDTQYNSSGPIYAPGTIEITNVVGFAPGTYYWKARALTQSTKSSFSTSSVLAWNPTLPAKRKTCEAQASATVVYADQFKLWTPNTRGSVLTCEYTPENTGQDAGGVASNQIQLDIALSVYSATATDTLVAEVYQANDYFRDTIRSIAVGANGYIIVTEGAIYMAGTIVPSAGTVRELSAVSTVSIVSTVSLKCSASNGSRYVVGGTGGTLVYSDTGYDAWTIVTNPPPTNIEINDIIWSSSLNLFVAVGGEFSSTTTGGKSYITTSPDGVTWTQRQYFSSANRLNAVAYNGTYFLALGSGFFEARSADGITWTNGFISGAGGYSIYSIAWDPTNTRWIVVGDQYTGGASYSRILTTDNTFTIYEPRYTGTVPGSSLFGVGKHSVTVNESYAVGSLGQILQSNDGITWNVVDNGATGTYYMCKVVGDLVYIMGENVVFNGAITSPSIVLNDVNVTNPFNPIYFWQTFRIWAYGSNPNSTYITTTQPVQDQLPNNVPITAGLKLGVYLAEVPIKYIMVVGNLTNPTTAVTVYASRRSLSITEFKG